MSRISTLAKPADSTGVSPFRRIPQWIFETSLISLPLALSIGVARGRVLNKRLFAAASAGILLSAVAASAQGLPYMLQATTDQPSYVNKLPSRVQNADQADPSDPQRGQSAESGIAPGKSASLPGPSRGTAPILTDRQRPSTPADRTTNR